MIELLYFQGYIQAEVTDEFGIPLGTVKTRVKAAIVQLRQYFVEFGLVIIMGFLTTNIMNTKEYIASGIIESYVLGVTTVGGSTEVEQLALEYPEIQTEIELVSNTIENFALQFEKEPPVFLKDKIKDQLFSEPISADRFQAAVHGGQTTVANEQLAGDNNQSIISDQLSVNSKEINENSPDTVSLSGASTSQWSIFRIAASWILLALSIGGNIWFFKNWKNSEEKLVALETQNQVLAQEGKALKASCQEGVAILQNPDFKVITLAGQPVSPTAKALIYFNKNKKEVFYQP